MQTENEKKLWKDIRVSYMSEESSGEEQDTLVVYHLNWRSNSNTCNPLVKFKFCALELCDLLSLLDERAETAKSSYIGHRPERKKRLDGTRSHIVPVDAPKWTIQGEGKQFTMLACIIIITTIP